MTWQIKLIAFIILIAGLFAWHKHEVSSAVKQTLASEQIKQDNLVKNLKIKSLETETKLNTQIVELETTKNAQIKTITTKYNSAIISLRQRPERSTESDSPRDSSHAESPGRTDDERLFGRHAEISLGIARDAEKLKIYLDSCYKQYDKVKEELNNYRK